MLHCTSGKRDGQRPGADRVRSRAADERHRPNIRDQQQVNKENDHGRGEGCSRKMPGMCGCFRVIRASCVDLAPVGLGRIQGLSI